MDELARKGCFFNHTECKKKAVVASAKCRRDDAEYEDIPVKGTTTGTGAVEATANITLTQNSAYSLPCEQIMCSYTIIHVYM